jgi:hypothetical protein
MLHHFRSSLKVLFFTLAYTSVQAQLFMSEVPNGAQAAIGRANCGMAHTELGIASAAQLVYQEGFQTYLGTALPYAIKDWQTASMDLGYQKGKQAFGVHFSGQKVPAYRESAVLLRYGRRFSPKLAVGLGLGYQLAHAFEYGKTQAPAFELSAVQQLTEKLSLGCVLTNLGQIKASEIETLSSIRLGLAWKASKDFEITSEIRKELLSKTEYALGMIYRPVDKFVLMAGIRSGNSAKSSFGFGLNFSSHLRADLSAVWHPVLGFTPSLGLRFVR